jgi:dTDP-4-dehydrorhamnose 3,5-epimerase-like enzyme
MAREKNWDKPYVIENLKVFRDERGVLYEAIRFSSQAIEQGGQIYVYTLAPGARRGDHYHERKCEWFTCVSGTVRILIKTKDGYQIDQIVDSENPKLVFAGPGTSHAVLNESDSDAVLFAYASKEFDPLDPDTIFKLSN